MRSGASRPPDVRISQGPACASPGLRVLVLMLAALLPGVVREASGQQPIRSGVVLVPVDVRVVDSRGEPVRNLTRADFEVYENDVRQDIAHFETITVDSDTSAEPLNRYGPNPALRTVSHRTFILLLGRGRLNHPAKGLDGLIDFVAHSLLPTDRVGIVAYLRASEPTVDHASIVRFLVRYRERHEGIESRIESHFATLAGLDLSAKTREAIDDLFRASGIPAFQELPGGAGRAAIRYSDWNYVRWAIADAGRLPGEKHLIIVSQNPIGVSQISDKRADHVLVRWASSARVAISYIHTGGLDGIGTSGGRISIRSSGDALTADAVLRQPGNHRLLAELTGGVSSYYSYASKPLEALERSSRFYYVLGYYPRPDASPNTQRRVKVQLGRSGMTLLYRQAYQQQPRPTDDDDFRQAAAEDRIQTALTSVTEPRRRLHNGQLPPVTTTLRISTTAPPDAASVLVSLSLDPTRLLFNEVDGNYRASVYVAVLVGGASEENVGSLRTQMNFTLSASEFNRTKREWLEFDVSVPLTSSPHRIRAAVYDYDSDRVFSALQTVQRKP